MDIFEKITRLTPDYTTKSSSIVWSPLLISSILGFYLYFVYTLGPRLMKNREPFKLTKLLVIYNTFQIVACSFLVKIVLGIEPEIFKFWDFDKIFITHNKDSKKLFEFVYFVYWLKLFDLFDTVFFVLRKKNNQISKLHVMHHTLTPCLAWLMFRYTQGKAAVFPIFLNSLIHIFMYLYYLVAAIASPNLLKKLLPLKKLITILQMIQLSIIMLHWLITCLFVKDQVPGFIGVCYMSTVASVLYLFYDFYQNAYKKSQKLKQ